MPQYLILGFMYEASWKQFIASLPQDTIKKAKKKEHSEYPIFWAKILIFEAACNLYKRINNKFVLGA